MLQIDGCKYHYHLTPLEWFFVCALGDKPHHYVSRTISLAYTLIHLNNKTMNPCFLFLTICLTMATPISSFITPSPAHCTSSLKVALDTPIIITESPSSTIISTSTSLSEGISSYLSDESTIMSSSQVVSLKERPPPPTAEEIAAKKRTFNLWFWGGGFVAPFLATFYYFGFKFWER